MTTTMDPVRLVAPARVSTLATSMRGEWRLARRDLAWWAALAVLLGCMTYALIGGRARVEARARAVGEARRDEARRLQNLTRLLGKIERGEVKPPDAPYRDPRNAIYVGRGQGATVAHLPDAPLAPIAVGLSDLYPQALAVSAGSKDSFLFVDEIANPAHLLTGGFDLAFVIVYLYPLLLLALVYNIRSGEAEQGTLVLTAASSAPLPTVLAGKLLVRAGLPIAGAAAWPWAWMAGRVGMADAAGLAVLSLAIVLHGAFWTALALWINAWRRDSAFNAVALVVTWVLLLLVLPAALNAVAQVLYPAPARAEMVLAVRGAAVDSERDRDAAEARYRAEHPDEPTKKTGPDAGAHAHGPAARIDDRQTRRTLDVTLAADARADAVLAEQERRVAQQRRLGDRLAYLAPPALVYDTLAELAGHGHTRHDDYLARVGRFHATWQSFFVDRARRGEPLTTADYAHFPRFRPDDPEQAWQPPSRRRIAASLGWLGLVTLLIAARARRLLARGL